MINPESSVYRIETLSDIFEKVPRDRIAICMRELTVAMEYAHQFKELHDAVGGDPNQSVFPGYVEWVDDDEGEFELDITNSGDPLAKVNFKLDQ